MEIKNIIQNNILRVLLLTAAVLSVPFLAEWPWTISDFMVMGAMIFTTGMMVNLAMSKMGKYKIPAVAVIILLFLWLWVELAVGLFTNWGS